MTDPMDRLVGPDDLLTLAAIAQWLLVQPSAVSYWRRRYDGEFPAPVDEVAGRPRFRRRDIASFLVDHGLQSRLVRALDHDRGDSGFRWDALNLQAPDLAQPLDAIADLGIRRPLRWQAMVRDLRLDWTEPQVGELGSAATELLRSAERSVPDVRRLRSSAPSAEAIIRAQVAPNAEAIVDLTAGEGTMLFAALTAAGGADALAIDVDPAAIAVVRSRAASQGRSVHVVVADATRHYFGGQQFDVVIAEPGAVRAALQNRTASRSSEPRVDDALLGVVERVLAPGGTALVVLPADFLERPASDAARRRLVENDMLDAVIALPDGDGRSKVLLVVRQGRTGDNGVLFVDGRGRTADRIVELLDRWNAKHTVVSSSAAVRDRGELLSGATNLSPRRWMRTDAERLGGAKAAASLVEEFAVLRAGRRDLAEVPPVMIGSRRSAGSDRLDALIRDGRVRVVIEPAGDASGLPTLSARFVDAAVRGSLRVTAGRPEADRREEPGGFGRLAHPGDVLVLGTQRRLVVAVWRGAGPVRVPSTARIHRPALGLVPEFLAMTLKAEAQRFAFESSRSSSALDDVEVPRLPEQEQHLLVEQYEQLAVLERAAEGIRDRARRLRRQLGAFGGAGIIRIDRGSD